MGWILKKAGLGLVILLVITLGLGIWYLTLKKAVRSGTLSLPGLTAPVDIQFDSFAVPHITAKKNIDAYHALGYVHAQDRLFQMELLRRLAKGELSEILGPTLKSTDIFFRTLRLKQFGEEYAKRADKTTPALRACQAYLDGVNHFIRTGASPVEFDLLRLPKTKFALSDVVSVAGYMAYSFASGFKTDPVISFVRDALGPAYLADLDFQLRDAPPIKPLTAATHDSLARMAAQVADIQTLSPVGCFEGSNAWAIRGAKTASGKPMLSGDPHISHSNPSVWYEAHLVTPDLNFYGHFLAGVPVALLGYNQHVAWSLTMFQNDDVDLFLETPNPANPDQVWAHGQWEDLDIEQETIRIKGEDDLILTVRRSHHGPIINDATDLLDHEKKPVAVSWVFHDFDNDMINGLYELSLVHTVFQAPAALEKIYAPGLNFVMADAAGNIGWWAVAKLPQRPEHVDPNLIQDGSDPANDTTGYLPFKDNPQFINPASGIIVSANQQPQDFGTGTVPGYYNIENRAQRIETLLESKPGLWTPEEMQTIQQDTASAFYKGIRDKIVGLLTPLVEVDQDMVSKAAFVQLKAWDGHHPKDALGPAVFYTLHYFLIEALFKDELGEDRFKAFLRTRLPDKAVPKLLGLENSLWWDDTDTPQKESREKILSNAWQKTMERLRTVAGNNPATWTWGDLHTVKYTHALGRKKPLDRIFNIGPFKVGGSRDVPNYQGFRLSPPPFNVYINPSTRRIFDFADPAHSLGIIPTGQSGYFLDPHYDDQVHPYLSGEYRVQLTDRSEIEADTISVLTLIPSPGPDTK